MYSFHSSLEEKNQLLHTLTTYGIETTVDRAKKRDRIREWIQSSAIVEENEEDESDMYEDSEFYEDEDNDGNESEETEPVSMRGRHFPERRPSAATHEPRRKRASRSAPTNRAPAKMVERKIPFAPQVAEERETFARFASFPNGDPSLAVVGNGSDRSRDFSATSPNATPDVSTNSSAASNVRAPLPSANGRIVRDTTQTNAISSQDDTSLIAPMTTATFPSNKQSPPRTTSSVRATTGSAANDAVTRVLPTSPRIPARKGRAHTAPFSDARSAENLEIGSARRAQSATLPRSPEVDGPPLPPRAAPMKTTSSSASGHPMTVRADGHPTVATLSTPRTARPTAAAALPVVRAAAPITGAGSAILVEPVAPNNVLPARVEGSPPVANAQIAQGAKLAATHLVTQNFNAQHGVAGGTALPAVSPMSSSSSLSRTGQRAVEEPIVAYGKDAYEHYGIAQGAILPMRVNNVRQDSTGSGSRSASN